MFRGDRERKNSAGANRWRFKGNWTSGGAPSQNSDTSGGSYHCLSSQKRIIAFRSTSTLKKVYWVFPKVQGIPPLSKAAVFLGSHF